MFVLSNKATPLHGSRPRQDYWTGKLALNSQTVSRLEGGHRRGSSYLSIEPTLCSPPGRSGFSPLHTQVRTHVHIKACVDTCMLMILCIPEHSCRLVNTHMYTHMYTHASIHHASSPQRGGPKEPPVSPVGGRCWPRQIIRVQRRRSGGYRLLNGSLLAIGLKQRGRAGSQHGTFVPAKLGTAVLEPDLRGRAWQVGSGRF